MRRFGGVLLAVALVVPANSALAETPGKDLIEVIGQRLEAALAASLELAERLGATPDRAVAPPAARIVRAGPRSSGAVALTFDDGYDHRTCARISDTLRRSGAVGTFFINGNHLKAAPRRWQRILRGMELGNHTRSHPDLTTVSHRVVRKQIRENRAIHERVLGRPMLPVLRPPYGAYGDRIARLAMEAGYQRVVLWNVDTGDWRAGTRPRRIVKRATGARPGSIILMHCSRPATARALPAIIRHYQSRGIALRGLSEVLRLP